MTDSFKNDRLQSLFSDSACPVQEKEPEKPLLPVSIRVTAEEKEQLQKAAGALSMSAYIRHRLFGDGKTARPSRFLKKQRQPQIDSELVARLLGTLGASDMTKALFGLLLAAKAKELEVTPEISDRLEQACSQIEEMRDILVLALNVRPRKDAGR
jgi:hypothetical protein